MLKAVFISSWNFAGKKVPTKNFGMIFLNLNFSNFSKGNLKTNFFSQLHVILTFIWCVDHTSHTNICWDMKLPRNPSNLKYHSHIARTSQASSGKSINIFLMSSFLNRQCDTYLVSRPNRMLILIFSKEAKRRITTGGSLQ